jgi:hypothetical protein
MAEVYLPTLHWFAMGNLFTGSSGMLRFRAKPNVVMATAKEVDFEASSITVELWHGLYCYEKSEMEGSREFPMSDEGLQQMKSWLEENI